MAIFFPEICAYYYNQVRVKNVLVVVVVCSNPTERMLSYSLILGLTRIYSGQCFDQKFYVLVFNILRFL